MSKVITFSRFFPKYHPRAGEPTFFVEKFYKSLFLMKPVPAELASSFNFAIMNDDKYLPKHHTIRGGNRWKVGDKFSPIVWSGKPYNSNQIIIAPDIEIKRIWDFGISGGEFRINDDIYDGMNMDLLEKIAKNDGLSSRDLLDWFEYPKYFQGQIICWNESVEY